MKLFAAIFLDGEIQGSRLEGLDMLSVAQALIDYLNTEASDSFPPEIIHVLRQRLTFFSHSTELCYQPQAPIQAIASSIYNELTQQRDVIFPGGWDARPAGHAMVYRLRYDTQGGLVFMAYNTGDGAEYHKQIDSFNDSTLEPQRYRETFNPVYAILFDEITNSAELCRWIETLLEPMIFPRDKSDYQYNNAESIYKLLFAQSAYLKGKVVDPDTYFPRTTTGQKSGTCAQYSLQQMVRSFLDNEVDYARFIFSYRLYALNKFIDSKQLPAYFSNHYQSAITHTARMITRERSLEKTLSLDEKQRFLNKLFGIEKKASLYFKQLPKPLKPYKQKPTICDAPLFLFSDEYKSVHEKLTQPIYSDLTPCRSLLLFNPEDNLPTAITCIQTALKKQDKRLFIHNVEQLCFVYCNAIKTFREKPLNTSKDDIETWAKVVELLHQSMFEYLTIYLNENGIKERYIREFYAKRFFKGMIVKSTEKEFNKAALSPRNQIVILALMTLQHYAAMHYHGALLDNSSDWQTALSPLDDYTGCIQWAMICKIMQRDFFLSNTDSNMSALFQALNEYYLNAPNYVDKSHPFAYQHMGHALIEHYSQLMQTDYLKEEKEALEAFFYQNADLFRGKYRLDSKSERDLLNKNLIAMYSYSESIRLNLKIAGPKTPKIDQLMHVHDHTDYAIALGADQLTKGFTDTDFIDEFSFQFDIGAELSLFTRLKSHYGSVSFIEIISNDKFDNNKYRNGYYRSNIEYDFNRARKTNINPYPFYCPPLAHDTLKKPYTSNEIALLSETVENKLERHLRTALPLQALDLLDYFTEHIDLLETRDNQFYLLFSLYQPGIIDKALAYQANVLGSAEIPVVCLNKKIPTSRGLSAGSNELLIPLDPADKPRDVEPGELRNNQVLFAIQTLYNKGIALGDLSPDTTILSHRGLFLIKLTSWLLGYLISLEPNNQAYQIYYQVIDEDVRYWMLHDTTQPVQTELRRVFFYNTMKRYTPVELSLPKNHTLLVECLLSYFFLKEHRHDRTPTTQTEDESFEPLFLNLLLLEPQAVQAALSDVLAHSTPKQAPFKPISITNSTYTYKNRQQQILSVHLLDACIVTNECELHYIPTHIRYNHAAFIAVIGSEFDPVAIQLDEARYQFEWHNDTYLIEYSKLFKQINGVWYKYQTNACLPTVLQTTNQFIWANAYCIHAFIMRLDESGTLQCQGEFKNNALHFTHGGVFCTNGAVRESILQAFYEFTNPSMIAVVKLNEDEYAFTLADYELSGHWSAKNGIMLDYNAQTYAFISDDTPLDTGVLLKNSSEQLYLTPIRPFYKPKSEEDIPDVNYHLLHTLPNSLSQEMLELPNKYAVFYLNEQGRLSAEPYSTNALYLVYLYCARFAFDKAYELINNYTPQEKPEELIYLHWLCEKLPAREKRIGETFTPNKHAIVTPILLAIQLKALLLYQSLDTNPSLKQTLPHDTQIFFSTDYLIDYITYLYNQYHRIADHLSDDKQLTPNEITKLACDVHLRQETKLRKEVDELNRLNTDKTKLSQLIASNTTWLTTINNVFKQLFDSKDKGKLDSVRNKQIEQSIEHESNLHKLNEKIKKQTKTISALYYKQHSGYLALFFAKKPQLANSISAANEIDFLITHATSYSEHIIDKAKIDYYEPHYYPYNNYEAIETQELIDNISPEKNTIYISKDERYVFIDEYNKKVHDRLDPIDQSSASQSQSLKELVIKDATQKNYIENGLGSIKTIERLLSLTHTEKKRHYTEACNQLSLRITDSTLMNQLKYFVCLIIEKDRRFDSHKHQLKTFCINTIVANEDLTIGLQDKRRDRLCLAICLLKALDYADTFRDDYNLYVKPQHKLSSLWNIFDKLKTHSPITPIISQIGVIGLNQYTINPTIITQKPITGLATKDDILIKPFANKAYELPASLQDWSDYLTKCYNTHQFARNQLIKSFEKEPLLIKQTRYNEVDAQLDSLDETYQSQLLASLPSTINSPETMKAIKTMLTSLSSELVDLANELKHHTNCFPIPLQTLLSLQVDQLSGKRAPIDLDRLLIQYALGLDETYLQNRQVPQAAIPLVRHTLTHFLRQVFLYRHYQRLLKALSEPLESPESKILLASLVLELAPLTNSPALNVFQYQTQKTVRSAQWEMIDRLTNRYDVSNRAEQLMMGQGKTKFILPQAIFLKADGEHLALVLVPDALVQTEYQDLKHAAKTIYNQTILLFQFDRNSPSDPVSLKRYLFNFEDSILQRKGLVMTPGSLQSLYLKRRELLYQGQFYTKNSSKYLNLIESLNLLNDIVCLLKNKADIVCDEFHKILDINVELNYSIGEKKSIHPDYIKTTLDLFDFLSSTPVEITDSQDDLFGLNGKSLLDFLNDPSMLYHPDTLIDKLISYYKTRYEQTHDLTRYSNQVNNLLRAQWHIFLQATLKSKANERYGQSLSDDVFVAIPYIGNNVPSTRLFEHFIESMNYSTQITHLNGVSLPVFKIMMRAWKKSDQLDSFAPISKAAERYEACLKEIKSNQVPQTLKLIDVSNESTLDALYPHFQHNKPFIRYALEEIILPSIKLYPHKLSSNAIHLAHLGYRIQGVSGTLANHLSFDKRIEFNQASSFGVKNKIKTLLKNKQTKLVTPQAIQSWQGIYALIDIGAHERGKTNQQVAIELAAKVQSSIKYVLFFKESRLAAWKVGGTESDIIMLPSTEPEVIERYLKGIKPEERFTYYSQVNATGTDILQASEACARVSVDITTTLSDFLQAVMRMRQLFKGQTIEIVISHALEDKLGSIPCLDDLYDCMEDYERNKLAEDAFKSACKQLFQVIQNDIERRLLAMDAQTSLEVFPRFQPLLIGENSTELPASYTTEQTLTILQSIKHKTLAAWEEAIKYSSTDTLSGEDAAIRKTMNAACDEIIQKADMVCNKTQQTSLSLGAEISVEQQQQTQVQVELETQQQIENFSELMQAREPDTAWVSSLSISTNPNLPPLSGDASQRNQLASLWNTTPVNWSNNVWLSTEFYLTHDKQPLDILPNDMAQKPVLAKLFWKSTTSEETYALIVSQEEAEVLATRLKDDSLSELGYQIWLETNSQAFSLAGKRPDNLTENKSYQALNEQIALLDGNVHILASKPTWVWFQAEHIPVLQQQMLKQEKQDDATLLIALASRIQGKLITRENPVDSMSINQNLLSDSMIKEIVQALNNQEDHVSFKKDDLMLLVKSLSNEFTGKPYINAIIELLNDHKSKISPEESLKTLQLIYEAILCLQDKQATPGMLAKKACACAAQGAKLANLPNKSFKNKKLAGLLLTLAGIGLIIASLGFAFNAPTIATTGITLGTSYLATSIALIGITSGLIGMSLFSTQKPKEALLQESLSKFSANCLGKSGKTD